MSLKTNPVYAHIAYRRAIVIHLLDELRENYLALSTLQPKKLVTCEDVFREDSVVPETELIAVVEELEQEAERLRLELGKFSFGKVQEENGLLSSKKAEEGRATESLAGVEESGNAGPRGRRGRRR